jgi:hypothetical protein
MEELGISAGFEMSIQYQLEGKEDKDLKRARLQQHSNRARLCWELRSNDIAVLRKW